MTADDRRLSVVVAIPTFRRPDKLAQLLDVLPQRMAEVADAAVRVVVVDNDPEGSARRLVESAVHLPVTYVLEARPGIASARNAALDAAPDAQLLAFIDDDEWPLEGWLSHLVETWRATAAAAVMGLVISVLPDDVDPWVVATGFFYRPERPTGLRLQVAAAGNLLLDLVQVRRFGVRFDPLIGLGGGEDTLFSRQLFAAGGTIVWCNESRARDIVPRERLSRSWTMKRAFSGGNTSVHIGLAMTSSSILHTAVRARALAGGASRVVIGGARHLAGRTTGDLVANARGLRVVYRGRGMIAGALGHHHEHYTRDASDE